MTIPGNTMTVETLSHRIHFIRGQKEGHDRADLAELYGVTTKGTLSYTNHLEKRTGSI